MHNLVGIMYSYFVEDAYHMDTELDGEVIGIDIVDTAGQVRPCVTHMHSCVVGSSPT